MSKQISIYAAALTSLLFCLFSVTAQAQIESRDRPFCQFASSDADGDGFGWENQTTCIVTADTNTESAPACIDDDGDGYGWDGSRVCRIDVICYDTAPVGDGFGWDGSNSCEIAAYDVPFSEIEVLKSESRSSILFGVELPSAIALCSINSVEVEFELFANGSVEQNIDGTRINTGLWSTGFEVSDGLVHLTGVVARWLVLGPDSIRSRDGGFGIESDCVWQ